MKSTFRKLIALVLVLAMVLSASALAAKQTPSRGFRLPAVKPRPTEAPVETEAPSETEEPAETEEPSESEVPAEQEPTEEPTAEPTVEPTEEPTAEPTVEPTAEPMAEPTVEPTAEPTAEPTEEPTAEPTEEPTVEPTAEPTVEPTEEPDLTGLRQIILVLNEGEDSLALYAAADANSEVLAHIAAGEILYVQNIEAEWSYAVYGDFAGFVRTDKIALFNETATPEEEEIIRTVKLTSNVSGDETVYAGTEIMLSAQLTGFDDLEYKLQWQYTPDNGVSVYDVPGANDAQYTFIIDESNAYYLWRVSVTIAEDTVE